MRSSARTAVATFLTVFCFAALSFAQAPAKQPAAKTARASVSGRVTIKDRPAPGVVVGLRRSDGMNPFDALGKAITDQDGVYRITNVAPGSYIVLPGAPAYVPSGSDYVEQPVVVGEDENVENVNFSLVRGGVITGKVTDADGRPVIQMQVDVFRADLLDRQAPVRQIYPVKTGTTDDRGIYRIFGLRPGKYKIGAGRSDEFSGGYTPTPRNYKQVFHPDVTDLAKATIVDVGEATETKDVDIVLGRTMQSFSVSGRVINGESGMPVPNVHYGLMRLVGEQNEYVNKTIAADARGDFIVEGLFPGKYGILPYDSEANELRLDTKDFQIIDQDVDLTIKLTKGASVFGAVVFDGDDKAARSKLFELELRGYTPNGSNFATSFSSMIGADGSFRFSGLQTGPLNISIAERNMPFPPKGFAISRIERDGVVVPRLEVKDGETVGGVKIFVTYGTASLRGVINVENGTLSPNARFILRIRKTGETNSFIRPPQVDARGHFLLEGLAAGVYELTAYVMGDYPGVQRRPATKENISLANGVVTDVTLTIDLAP